MGRMRRNPFFIPVSFNILNASKSATASLIGRPSPIIVTK